MSQHSEAEEACRAGLSDAKRIVVKVGTRVITNAAGRLDRTRLRNLVDGIAALKARGCEVLLVTSAAIAAGVETLQLKTRPKVMPELQMCAAVGQAKLMALYGELFKRRGLNVGQILLTDEDFEDKHRRECTRNTLLTLLANGIVPIINENDTVSVDEIKIGDNDFLAALVSMFVGAEALVLLTSSNGLKTRPTARGSRRLRFLKRIGKQEFALAVGKSDELSTGGMRTKLQAGRIAARSGAAVIIADGRKRGVLQGIFRGDDLGTLISKVSR